MIPNPRRILPWACPFNYNQKIMDFYQDLNQNWSFNYWTRFFENWTSLSTTQAYMSKRCTLIQVLPLCNSFWCLAIHICIFFFWNLNISGFQQALRDQIPKEIEERKYLNECTYFGLWVSLTKGFTSFRQDLLVCVVDLIMCCCCSITFWLLQRPAEAYLLMDV